MRLFDAGTADRSVFLCFRRGPTPRPVLPHALCGVYSSTWGQLRLSVLSRQPARVVTGCFARGVGQLSGYLIDNHHSVAANTDDAVLVTESAVLAAVGTESGDVSAGDDSLGDRERGTQSCGSRSGTSSTSASRGSCNTATSSSTSVDGVGVVGSRWGRWKFFGFRSEAAEKMLALAEFSFDCGFTEARGAWAFGGCGGPWNLVRK
jgi:hypothetical protein